MTKRPSITTVNSGFLSSETINANYETIAAKFDNTLSLDGSTPNSMSADFDMNGNDILNAGSVNTSSLYIGGSLVTVTTVSAISGIETYSTVAAMVADTDLVVGQIVQTLGYYSAGDGGGNYYEVVAASTGTVDGGRFINLATHQAKGLFVNGDIYVDQFGAVGDGSTDDHTAISNAFTYYKTQQNVFTSGGSGGNVKSKGNLVFNQKVYRVSQKITVDDIRAVNIIGKRSILIGEDSAGVSTFADYILELTGSVFDVTITGLCFESTSTGCIKIDADNISMSQVDIVDCRFITDAYSSETGIAIDYTNRSSILKIKDSVFNRIRQALHVRNGDLHIFDNCWFGTAINATYSNKQAYIQLDKGFHTTKNSLFAGGPGDKTGTETAFYNVGVEGAAAPDADNGGIVIRDTRIGFEAGAGFLVNWFVENNNNASDFHNGIVLKNITTSPREDKVTVLDSTTAAGLIRLFNMPHRIEVDGVACSLLNLVGIDAGSTTSLSALRGVVPTVLPQDSKVISFIDDQDSSFVFEWKNVTSQNIFLVEGTDKTEYNRWMEMFGLFDYIWKSDTPTGVGTEIYVDPWFTDFSTVAGQTYEVYGFCEPRVSTGTGIEIPVHGHLHVQYDESANSGSGALWAVYKSLVDDSNMPISIEIKGGFKVSGTWSESINHTTNGANATLSIRLRHAVSPGSVNVACPALMIRPITYNFNRKVIAADDA